MTDDREREFRLYPEGGVRRVTHVTGRSQEDVTCPFCGTVVRTFIWSRFGNGKRCPCGVILSGYGATRKLVP